jgi:hypothetical protein
MSEEKHPRMSHIDTRRIIYGESWWEIALIPLRVFYDGQDDTPKYFDGKTSPFLLLLTPFAFFGLKNGTRQEKTEKMILLFFSILFLLYACAQTSIRIRYFSPILPPLVVLSMYGLHNIHSLIAENRRFSEPIKMTIFFAIITICSVLMQTIWSPGSSRISLCPILPGKSPVMNIFRHIVRNTHPFNTPTKIFRKIQKYWAYTSEIEGITRISISFNIELLQQLASQAVSAQDVSEKLREKHITHLLVNFSLFNYWVQHYSLHEKQMLKDFFDQYVVTEFSKDGYGLLRLK